jgi:hypothetical protein
MWQPLLLSAGCIPALILLAAVSIERWRRKRRGERQPLSDKLLRPPGYSLQLKLEELSDRFNGWFAGAFLYATLSIVLSVLVPAIAIVRIINLITLGLIAAVCTVFAWRTRLEILAYRMGLLGEQAMAEELQRLVSCGYRIFHDIPCEKRDCKWNVDHVAVGPAGVFAIETKYRTKLPGKAGEDHKAEFDGSKIQFSSGNYDADAPEQARQNARWLATLLTKATGERVTTQPIVALPGWWVTLKANSDVKVLSGKQVVGYIAKEPAQLSDKAIQQISYQLEQRCRDVAF